MDLDTIALREQAIKEIEAEKAESVTEEVTPTETSDTETEAETPATDETTEKAETETTDEEEQPAEETKPAADVEKPATDDVEARITAYAEKNRMTLEEAREDIEKIEKVKAQYKNDPEEMARALRNKDREYQKLRTETEKAKPKEPVFKRMTEEQFHSWAKGRFQNPDAGMVDADGNNKFVAEFRRKYPAKSEIMSDDAIIEEIIDVSYREYQGVAAQKEAEVKQTAAEKREELVKSITEADVRFIPDVKAILQKTNDAELLEDGFDIDTALCWAKGRRYDADIKAAEERGAKRAAQKPTIAGVKPAASGVAAPKTDKTVASTLNDAQKKRATSMFSFMEENEAYEAFREVYAEQLKKNKNFCT